jgi:CheY-like chemotaxis protein
VFIETVRELMSEVSNGHWEVLTASSPSQAFGILQAQPIDLVVVDVQMGVMDGIQMLSLLNRGYPNVQKAVLTGYTSEKYRAACLSNGAELFLEKPTTPSGWQSLYGVLNELIKLRPEEGFRGVLRRVGLQDVIQMECLARSSSVLEVSNGQVDGKIFIETGQIVHAQVGIISGEDAFNELLSLRGGQFALKPFSEPSARSVSGQWEFLLMEAARKSDEAKGALAAEPAPVEGANIAAEIAQLESDTATRLAQPLDPLSSYELVPVVPAGVSWRPKVDEMLILSQQGDVIYDWQCANVDVWVNFFEFASQRGQRLAQILPLGDFDRLDIQSGGARVVVMVSKDQGVLVKTRREAV